MTKRILCTICVKQTLNFIGYNGTAISCCGSVSNAMHPECFPVIVRNDDDGSEKCMEFVRSSPASTCNFGNFYSFPPLNATFTKHTKKWFSNFKHFFRFIYK